MKKILPLLFFLAFTFEGLSQSFPDILLKDIQESRPLTEFLSGLEKQYPVRFFYLDEWLTGYEIDSRFNNYTLIKALEELLSDSDISIITMHNYSVVFIKDVSKAKVNQDLLHTAALRKKQIEQVLIGNPQNSVRKGKVTLQGVIKSETGIPLEGVLISVEDLDIKTGTDAQGRYQISMPAGEHVLNVQLLNYTDQIIDLHIYSNGTHNLSLEEAPILLEEIEVSDQAILSSRGSQSVLKIKDMKRAPALLGEVDIIKSVQTQPGVTTVGEIASGFNVRGGSVDQNLVLLDGIPVFNTSHALGFFTAFNSDAVGQVSFHRGGIPAMYGGRVSSVMSITSREGDKQKWTATGGIGIISSYLTIGGPIKTDTTSILVSARSSYSDWMLDAIKSKYQNLENSSMSFYDGMLKFSHKFSNKTKILLSGYTSRDQFTLSNDTLYSWRNWAGSIRVDHVINDRLSASVSLGAGQYGYRLEEKDPGNAFALDYGVTYPILNFDFNYSGRHELSFGLQNTFYDFSPGHMKPTNSESVMSEIKISHEKSLESALYFSDGFYWRDDLYVEAGLRYSQFNRIGPAQAYIYEAGKARETQNIVDSVSYGSGEIMKTYHGLEPRASLRYTLTPHASVKLGYNRMYQYLHLITNTAAVTPMDIWQSSNTYFKPQIADQISLGYYRNLKDNTYETFVEGYYKHVKNTLDFKDGADLILNEHPETAFVSGMGKSFGVEFSITKIKGRLIGSLNYAFSRSFRKVDSEFSSEKINNGKEFPANIDQPHVVNLSWRYGLSRRFFFSGNFVYHTGRPLSLPRSAYNVDGVPISDFSERNKYRLTDYHRMDLAIIMEGNHKRKKLGDGTWSLSFYNAYGRKNAYSVFFKDNGNGRLQAYKLSVIGTIIPSLSYSFKI